MLCNTVQYVICIPWASSTGNFICLDLYAEIYFYVDSQEWVDDSDSQFENKLAQRSPNEPKR